MTAIGIKTGYPRTSVTSDAKAATTASFTTAPAPTITGKAAIGSTLTGATGTWTPTPGTFTYQWKRGGAAISGATATTYRVVAADAGASITLTVTASAPGYRTTARTSSAVAIPARTFTTTPVPTYSGKMTVGSTLTAAPGTWAPVPDSLTYQWSRDGAAITGATSQTYTIAPADSGKKITVTVTARKAGYTPASKTSAAQTSAPAPFTSAPSPSITGTASVGSTVRAVTGTWAPVPATFAYQWRRNGTAIAGATASTYRVGTADAGTRLSVSVTASAPGYVTTTRVSSSTSVPTLTFATVPVPTFSGTPTVDSVLTASTGSWAPTPDSYTFQWNRGSSPIAGATASTYQVVAADVGSAITVTVTARKAGYTAAAATSTAATVGAATFTSAPTPAVTGLARVGGTLFGVVGTWAPQPSKLTYQWTRNGIAIPGATSTAYLVTTEDRGAQLRFTVTGSKAGYTTLKRMSAAQTVPGVFSSTPTPRISGTIEIGKTVTASTGTWTPTPDSFGYQWKRNGTAINGATSKTYAITQADAGAKLTVTVTGMKANYASTSKTSTDKLVPSTVIVRVTSDIVADTTWAPTFPTVYVVSKDVSVAPGSTLTIAAGTVVKFAENTTFMVEGSLVVNGTSAAPVTFTSLADDSVGGDTLADGDDTKPEDNRWNGIHVNENATLVADQTRVTFSSGITSDKSSPVASARVTGSIVDSRIALHSSAGAVTVTGTTVRGSIGASSRGGATTVTNNTVSRDTSNEDWDGGGFVTVTRADGFDAAYPLNVTGNTITNGSLTVVSANNSAQAAPIKVTGNTISEAVETPLTVADVKLRPSNVLANTLRNNTINAIALSGTLVENWTLPTTGPRLILNRDLSYYDSSVDGGIRISAGTTLTAPAGTTVKAEDNVGITVEGSLVVNGTSAAPVTFTSLADDSVGGDTLADGDDTKPEDNRWNGIHVNENATLVADQTRVTFSSGITSDKSSPVASARVTGSIVDSRIALHSSAGAVTVTGTTVRGSIGASSRGGATTVTNNTVSRDTSNEDWDGGGFVTVTRADGFDAAYPLNVTGNTITNGSLTVVSANNSAQAAPIKVTGNTISEAVETPLTVADVKLRPSNVLANTLRNNTINAIALSGTLVENWTLPTTGPRLILNRDLSYYDSSVDGGIRISAGTTLTAPAGTTVKAEDNVGITVEGSLVVNGTSAAPVTFTSLADDSVGGDTLADGDDTKPEDNRWNGIHVNENATLVADQTRVTFSSGITSDKSSPVASARVTGSIVDSRIALHSSAGAVTVTGTTVRGSIGASSRGGATTVTNNTVSRDTSNEDWDGGGFVTVTRADGFDAAYPLNVTGNTITNGSLTVVSANNSAQAAPIKVTGNTISEAVETPLTVADVKLRPSNVLANTLRNNTINAIALSGTLVENWTLPTTGPRLILNRDLSYYDSSVDGGIRISAGTTLTAPAGTTVKAEDNVGITVEGSLVVNGTSAAPVTFTSLADDSVGGDTLADGDDTKPEDNRWNGITIGDGGVLSGSNLTVTYASTAILSTGTVDLSSSRLEKAYQCISAQSGTVSITGSIQGCEAGVEATDGGRVIARNVSWGTDDGPEPFGKSVPIEGNVDVVPWVGYVAPPTPPVVPVAAAPSTCADLIVLVARGSGEVPKGPWNVASDPDLYDVQTFQTTVESTYAQRGVGAKMQQVLTGQETRSGEEWLVGDADSGLLNHLSDEYKNSTLIVPIVYPASDVSLLGEAFNLLKPKPAKLLEYMSSIRSGTDALRETYDAMREECSDEQSKFIISGYSQGAMAAHIMLSEAVLDGEPLDDVAAVVLLSDPLQQPGTYMIDGTGSGKRGLVASLFEFSAARNLWDEAFYGDYPMQDARSYPSELSSRTYAYCTDGDLLCAPYVAGGSRSPWLWDYPNEVRSQFAQMAGIHGGYGPSTLRPFGQSVAESAF
ncbi:cutinase family protein [Microbacterium sp. SORGH_AS_0969]|uniref:cutinase family protein n=2 Tax=unclassified Microbacterium TaxID=2609290 RepID=UPI0027D8EFD6|nr:cutinase family protein [Microbacterium sp. SORGH_AS_0969]